MIKIKCFIFFIALNTYAQKRDVSYTSFSSENSKEYRIKFINDSVVKFSNIPTHGSRMISFTTKWFKQDEHIFIDIKDLNENEKNDLKSYKLDYLENKKIILLKNKTELIDIKNETVYVQQKVLNRKRIKRKSITIINDKKFIVDRGITNYYGLIEKMPKGNEKLKQFLIENAENKKYTNKILRGLKAYQSYGILGINGVCIITENK